VHLIFEPSGEADVRLLEHGAHIDGELGTVSLADVGVRLGADALQFVHPLAFAAARAVSPIRPGLRLQVEGSCFFVLEDLVCAIAGLAFLAPESQIASVLVNI
jgi:hypothetical protein